MKDAKSLDKLNQLLGKNPDYKTISQITKKLSGEETGIT